MGGGHGPRGPPGYANDQLMSPVGRGRPHVMVDVSENTILKRTARTRVMRNVESRPVIEIFY